MKAIYESKELALKFDKKQEVRKAPASGYSDDKWNPGDIWMSTYDPNPSTSKPLDYGKGGESCNIPNFINEKAEKDFYNNYLSFK